MRVRALFVAAVALVATFALIGTASASHPVAIDGRVGEVVDDDAEAKDALRYVGTPAPDGFSHDYQWGTPFITTLPPEHTPVVLEGTLSLGDRVEESTALIGLLDLGSLEAGNAQRQVGAYIYVHSFANGDVRIGVTDGNVGGEVVQRSIIIPDDEVPDELEVTFIVDGGAETDECASHADDVGTADGCMILQVGDEVSDSYGTITATDVDVEFADGSVPGWEVVPEGDSGIGYDLVVTPAERHTTKQDCKKGGYKDLGFKNQGQCIKHHKPGHGHGKGPLHDLRLGKVGAHGDVHVWVDLLGDWR